MAMFVLGIGLLVSFLLAARWFVNAEPKDILAAGKWIFLALLGLIGLFFLLTGKWVWLFYMLPALLPWLMRARSLGRTAKNFSRMASGGGGTPHSEVETEFVVMRLNPNDGDINGTVRKGTFEGRDLHDLSRGEVLSLYDDCVRADAESARLLAAYLDRRFPNWRDDQSVEDEPSSEKSPPSSSGAMTRDEALQVLGLKEGASKSEIKSAYQTLIANLHPDRGGSDYLAAKINDARDILLNK